MKRIKEAFWDSENQKETPLTNWLFGILMVIFLTQGTVIVAPLMWLGIL